MNGTSHIKLVEFSAREGVMEKCGQAATVADQEFATRQATTRKTRKPRKARVCPRCGGDLGRFPALSRADDETDICSECGTEEAMIAMTLHQQGLSEDEIMDALKADFDEAVESV